MKLSDLGFFVCLLILQIDYAFAQGFAVDMIPVEMIKGSPAVVREAIQEVYVGALGQFSLKKKTVTTIFNKEADELGLLKVGYSNDIKLRNITGTVYDRSGKQILKAKKSDIIDYSNFSSFSIYEDNRMKILDMRQANYPYTVEFEYELDYPNLFYIPNWVPQTSSQVPVQFAKAVYDYPQEVNLRYFARNLNDEQAKKSVLVKDKNIVEYTIGNLPSFKVEPLTPIKEVPLKMLYAKASTFKFGEFHGDLSSWESISSWFYELNMGKDQLSETTKADVARLTSGLNSTSEKVQVLYEYMQNKTRYVSIQLGIGGLMPFDAASVEKYGYGDCKALSNFMGAILKEAKIPSNYALIHAGLEPKLILEEFPADYFNHAILAVPLEKDTVWLECTSQTNPFGYLGQFTSDRKALLVADKGGKLVNTPKYLSQNNVQMLDAQFQLDETGTVRGSIGLSTTGLQTENGNLLGIINGSESDKKEWVSKSLLPGSLDIQTLNFTLSKAPIPSIQGLINLQMRAFANKSGNRLFIQMNQMNQIRFNLTAMERENSFERGMGFHDFDKVELTLPIGYIMENLPESIHLDSDFGTYTALHTVENDKLIFNRKLILIEGIFPAEKYAAYQRFLSQVEKSDKVKTVIKKAN